MSEECGGEPEMPGAEQENNTVLTLLALCTKFIGSYTYSERLEPGTVARGYCLDNA
jgi:hypothetical protein